MSDAQTVDQIQPTLAGWEPTRPGLRREQLADVVRSLAAEVEPGTEEFQAGMLVLALSRVGHNVAKAARLAGASPAFAAICARRLYDNGVWTGGPELVEEYEEDADAFVQHIAVAQGRLCRTVSDDGEASWAAPGAWREELHSLAGDDDGYPFGGGDDEGEDDDEELFGFAGAGVGSRAGVARAVGSRGHDAETPFLGGASWVGANPAPSADATVQWLGGPAPRGVVQNG